MQPIVPPVYRTGNTLIDRQMDAIALAFRRLGNLVGAVEAWITIYVDPTIAPGVAQGPLDPSPGSAWPAKTAAVQVDANDLPVGLWINLDATATGWSRWWPVDEFPGYYGGSMAIVGSNSPGTSPLVARGNHSHPMPSITPFPGFYPGPMAAVGADNPGDVGTAARGNHSHPAADPMVEGSYLYTALIPGQAWTACATVFGGYIHPWNNGWTETSLGSGVWNRDAVGAITESGIVTAFFDGVTPTLGMRLFSTYSPSAPWRMFDGIYTVTDLGSDTTHAQVTRATDLDASVEFVVGKYVQVTGGASNTGHLFRYDGPASPTVDTDALTWTDLGVMDPPAGDRFELLTGAQLTSEGASLEEYEEALNIDAADGETSFTTTFATLDNTPGVAEYAAGMTTFQAMAVATPGSAGSETTLTARLYKQPLAGLPTLLLEATSLDITGGATGLVQWQKYLASPAAMNPTDRLLVIWNATTTSTSTVAVHLVLNNWQRTTRIRTTIQMASPSAPSWADIVPTGSATFPLASATLAAGGKFTLGPADRYLVDPSGFDLRQISTPAVPTGCAKEITLVFTGTTKLQHAVSPDSGFSALYLHHAGSIYNPLVFGYAQSSATFLWQPVLAAWLLTTYRAT
jgi:hypothetical protein